MYFIQKTSINQMGFDPNDDKVIWHGESSDVYVLKIGYFYFYENSFHI
jgi:hypothetical protein